MAEEGEDRVEETQATFGGIARVHRRDLPGDARHQPRELIAEGAELAPGGVGHGEVVADRLHEGQEAGRQLAFGAGAGQDLGAAGSRLADEFGHQPALADTGVAGDEDRPAGAFSRLLQQALELGALACAADQDWTEDAFGHRLFLRGAAEPAS